MQVIVLTLGWLVGIWLIDAQPQLGWATAVLIGSAAALIYARPKALLAGLLLLGLGAGGLRMHSSQKPLPANHIQHYLGTSVLLQGEIAAEPRWTPTEQRFTLAVAQVRSAGQTHPTQGLIQVTLPPEPPHQLGEQLVISGTLHAPRTSGSFDYAAYLARHNVYGVMYTPQVQATLPPASSPYQRLLQLKSYARTAIMQLVPEPEAALLIGILLGIQSSIPPDLWEAFNRTGTSHILVISGWNISILILCLLAIGRRLGWRRWTATLAALGVVIVYVALVGPSASVVRAALMGAIVACAAPLGRKSDAWTALALACFVMTALNPHTLWDLGFQLSALATASLFAWGNYVQRPLQARLEHPWLSWMIEPLTATLAAQVWALPLIIYQFGRLSLIAPLANILITPAVPLAMACGAALTVAGLLWRWLALLALPLTWLALTWQIRIAQGLAQIPWATVAVENIHGGWIIGWYGLTLAYWWQITRAEAADAAAAAPEHQRMPELATSAPSTQQ